MKNGSVIHGLKRGSRARRERRLNPSFTWGDLSTGYYIAPRWPAKVRPVPEWPAGWVSLGFVTEDGDDDRP